MKRSSKILIALALILFACGVGWGVWREQQRRQLSAAAAPLRVLCAENWLSTDTLERFSREHDVPIQLFTYKRPGEFLRQMANSDGKVDVVCSSSFLLRSLVRAKWIKQANYLDLPNARTIAVDFAHMPYDSQSNFSLPLFWNLYGFFGTPEKLEPAFKQTLQNRKVALWGEELNILNLLAQSGVKIEEKLESEQNKGLDADIHSFIKMVGTVLRPEAEPAADAAAFLGQSEWAVVPLSRVSEWLDDKHRFLLPEDGAALEVGLISVGERSLQPELALALINELIHPDHGSEVFTRLRAGLVHSAFDNNESIPQWLRPGALRRFPLNRLRFPDMNVETLPRFEKIYDENLDSRDRQ